MSEEEHWSAALELSVRTSNVLRNPTINGQPIRIDSLDDLCTLTESDLLRMPNFGRKSLRELTEILDSLGRSLSTSGSILKKTVARLEEEVARLKAENRRLRAGYLEAAHILLGVLR